MNTPEQELAGRTTSGTRYFELDALRGVAAVIVVLHHTRLFFFEQTPPWYLVPFFSGTNSVLLFFVLSGYVLSLAFWRGKQLPYPQYLLRRFFRIYVPYAAACLLAIAIGRHLLYSKLPLTHWFYGTWQVPLTLPALLRQLLKMPQDDRVNTAFWSLRFEVELSIVFPLLCRLLLRLRPLASLGVALVSLFSGAYLASRFDNTHVGGAAETIMFGACFMLGAILAGQDRRLATWYGQMGRWARAGLAVAALSLYWSQRTEMIVLGACLALLLARYSPASRWLDTPLPEYLGKISYSLYLVHGTVLFATVILLYGHLPTALVVVIGLAASFGMAHLFNLLLEEPADRLGKRLAGRMRVRAAASSSA